MTAHRYRFDFKFLQKMHRKSKNCERPVLCVEKLVVYPSAREAARKNGIASSGIVFAVNGKLKTSGGYHWKYVEVE